MRITGILCRALSGEHWETGLRRRESRNTGTHLPAYCGCKARRCPKVFHEPFSGRRNQRPVFDDLLAFVRSQRGKVKYLIFRGIDRFTRKGSFSYEKMKAELAMEGVELIDSYGIIQPARNTLEHLGVEYEWSRQSPSEIAEIVMAN